MITPPQHASSLLTTEARIVILEKRYESKLWHPIHKVQRVEDKFLDQKHVYHNVEDMPTRDGSIVSTEAYYYAVEKKTTWRRIPRVDESVTQYPRRLGVVVFKVPGSPKFVQNGDLLYECVPTWYERSFRNRVSHDEYIVHYRLPPRYDSAFTSLRMSPEDVSVLLDVAMHGYIAAFKRLSRSNTKTIYVTPLMERQLGPWSCSINMLAMTRMFEFFRSRARAENWGIHIMTNYTMEYRHMLESLGSSSSNQ